MAYQSLILGVLFSIAIFAVKSGAGITYFVASQKKMRAKFGAFLLFALIYLVVFAAAAFVLERIDPVRHMTTIQTFIQSGMIVHLVMAALLMVWGVLLLRHKKDSQARSRGWLMLAVPCPVCVTVIFLSSGFLITLFPDTPKLVILAFYLTFILINLLTMGMISLYRQKRVVAPEAFLGGAMLLSAVYFFLSVTIMPHFADMEKIYRLAMYQGQAHSRQVLYLLPFSLLTATAFLGGYGFTSKKIRSLI